jgi:transcriptional regulator with XRE-family HTH domain
MLAVQFGGLIKKGRMAKGLKQSELARAADVSRTVLSKLEQGKPRPVQTDVLDRILHALELAPQWVADSALEDRRRVRLEQQARIERQRSRHLRLAVDLASDAASARNLIAKARDRVELWRRNKTCSPLYIKRWSEMLALPPGKLARRMASLGEWEDALFQNSPWSWAWT